MTDLGKRLKEARMQNNLSLEELQNITKIQKRYLQAIEAGKLDMLPGKFYARAFIKQYAEAVGLDPEQLFDEYSHEVPKTNPDVPANLTRTQKKQTPVSKTSSFIANLLPKVLIFILIIGVVVFIWIYFQKGNADDMNTKEVNEPAVERLQDENVTIVHPDEEAETDEEAVVEEETPTEDHEIVTPAETPKEPTVSQQLLQVEQIDGKAPTTTYELKGTDRFIVELSSTGNSYIGIENSKGKSFYSGELKAGETLSYDFTGEEEIKLNIGYALDVNVKINEQEFEYPFLPNEKVHQKINIRFMKELP